MVYNALTYLEVLAAATAAYLVGLCAYNYFLHPLRSFPGPLSRHISVLPWAIGQVRGRTPIDTCRLHENGHRVGELAASAPTENSKAQLIYGNLPEFKSIINADRDEHAMLRRALSHGFSERSVRGQESFIAKYVDLLVRRLREQSASRDGEVEVPAVDLMRWLGFTTFDVVSDLVFSEPLGMLEKQEYHPFVDTVLPTIKWSSIMSAVTSVGLGRLVRAATSALQGTSSVQRLQEYVKAMVKVRMAVGEKRADLFQGLVPHFEKGNLDMDRTAANAAVLVIAGSETTTTTLCGTVFLLLKHPECLRQLQEEVRSQFSSAEDITITAVSNMPYLLACLSETLRLYPPVTHQQVREVAQGGQTIAGHFVPAGTLVEVQQVSMNHMPGNWAEPTSYHPERFLKDADERWARDQKEALQPFNTGPRNCIGKNLAYAEMRLILARLVFEFDFALAEESRDWMEGQASYGVWVKPPLRVHLKPVTSP